MLTLVAYNGSCVSSCYGTVYTYSGKRKILNVCYRKLHSFVAERLDKREYLTYCPDTVVIES